MLQCKNELMSERLQRILVNSFIVLILAWLFSVILTSCSTSRQVHKVETTKDSTADQEKNERIERLQADSAEYHRQIQEMELLGVTIKEQPCDTAAIRKAIADAYKGHDCPPVNIDSIIRSLAPKPTTVKKGADGSLEISSSYITGITQAKTKLEQENATLKSTVATLIEQNAKLQVHTVESTSTKDKVSKTKMLTGSWWLFLLIGAIGGVILWERVIKKFKFINLKTTNMKTMILFALCCMFMLSGCANFYGSTQSIWSEGLWILPVISSLAALWFLYVSYKASRSGSTGYDYQKHATTNDNVNIPIYKVAQFKYFLILTLATIGIIIWVYAER
jgi:hypothetical protein